MTSFTQAIMLAGRTNRLSLRAKRRVIGGDIDGALEDLSQVTDIAIEVMEYTNEDNDTPLYFVRRIANIYMARGHLLRRQNKITDAFETYKQGFTLVLSKFGNKKLNYTVKVFGILVQFLRHISFVIDDKNTYGYFSFHCERLINIVEPIIPSMSIKFQPDMRINYATLIALRYPIIQGKNGPNERIAYLDKGLTYIDLSYAKFPKRMLSTISSLRIFYYFHKAKALADKECCNEALAILEEANNDIKQHLEKKNIESEENYIALALIHELRCDLFRILGNYNRAIFDADIAIKILESISGSQLNPSRFFEVKIALARTRLLKSHILRELDASVVPIKKLLDAAIEDAHDLLIEKSIYSKLLSVRIKEILSELYNERGDIYLFQKCRKEAKKDYAKSINLLAKHVSISGAIHPTHALDIYTYSCHQMGKIHFENRSFVKSSKIFSKIIKNLEMLVKDYGDECPIHYIVDLNNSLIYQAKILRERNDDGSALLLLKKVIHYLTFFLDRHERIAPVAIKHLLINALCARAWIMYCKKQHAEAIKDLLAIKDLRENLSGLSLEIDEIYCDAWLLEILIYGCTKTEKLSWARGVSQEMCEIIDSFSPIFDSFDLQEWSYIYYCFVAFHRHWLSFAISNGETHLVTEIISIMQGREITNSLMEELITNTPNGLPTAVIRYLEARKSIRRLREKITFLIDKQKKNIISETHSLGISTSIGQSSSLRYENGISNSKNSWNRLELLISGLEAEEWRRRKRLAELRAYAALEPGYSSLAATHHPIHLETAQSLLKDDAEVILLLIKVPDGESPDVDKNLAIIIRQQGNPEIVALGDFQLVCQGISTFRLPGTRAYRRDGSNVNKRQVAPLEFWKKQKEALHSALWSRIDHALVGISRIIVLTYGDLHLLPLGHIHPFTGATIFRFPGIEYFQRLRQPKLVKEAICLVGVVSHLGDDKANLIPLVKSEVAMVHDLYANNVKCDYPAFYPFHTNQPVYDLLHIACHGTLTSSDSGVSEIPVLHIGSSKSLDRLQVLASRNYSRHVYLSACLGGRIDVDMTGSPAGIITAMFQKGALSVCAALVTIPDEGAWLLACLFHYCLSKGTGPVGALHQAQDLLAEAAARRDQGLPPWEGDLQPWLASQMDLLKVTQGAHLYQFLRGLSEKGGRRLPPGWLKKYRESLIPWMGYVPDERIEDLLQSAYRLGGYDEAAYGGFVDQVMASLPLLPAPPEEPALGALLYGFVAYGER